MINHRYAPQRLDIVNQRGEEKKYSPRLQRRECSEEDETHEAVKNISARCAHVRWKLFFDDVILHRYFLISSPRIQARWCCCECLHGRCKRVVE